MLIKIRLLEDFKRSFCYAFKSFDFNKPLSMRRQKAHTALWFYYVKPQAYAFSFYAQTKGAYRSSQIEDLLRFGFKA